MIQAAAVIGREFPLTLLQKIVEGERDLPGGLQHLKELGLIYDKGVFPEPRYLFKHALTQDVAYHSLLTPRRQALHEAIGSTIDALYPEGLEEQCELLAHHFTGSVNAEKAVHYLSFAGKKAARLLAAEQALACFKDTLKLLQRLPGGEALTRQEIEILFEMQMLYDNFAKRDEQRSILEQMIRAVSALDDPELLADAYIRRGEFLSLMGAAQDALACVDRALTLTQHIGDTQRAAKALRE